MRYEKKALSIADQVSQLKQRGLVFSDEKRGHHYLTHIGYYRLSAYWLPFEQVVTNGQPRHHQFQVGTTFEQVLLLYIFDRQLRLLVMEAIERIETAVRTNWAHELAIQYGPHAYLDVSLFKNPWQHASDIARIAKALEESSEAFVVHYIKKYDEPYLPPIWSMVETLSLGALSRWFKATKSTQAKLKVTKNLGMPTIEVLEQVLHALTPVRNISAHHGRLWNRRLTLQLPNIKRLKDQMIIERNTPRKQSLRCKQCTQLVEEQGSPREQQQPARQIYNYLLVMAYLMRRISPSSTWPIRLKRHIQTTTPLHQETMGFPEDWAHREIWQEKIAEGSLFSHRPSDETPLV